MDEISKTLEFAARFAAQKGIARFTRFLDPAQVFFAEQIARSAGARFECWGGYGDAERAIGCFYLDDAPEQADYPLVCLHSVFSAKFCSLTHRDLLGAFMALGLTRDCIGDIIISDADVYLFASEQIADFVLQSMSSAGKVPLRFKRTEDDVIIPQPKGTLFHDTVSALRLDAVIASAYRLSRSEAAELIRAGAVKLDHIPCDRTDAAVKEKAMLSLRGMGRIRLERVEGLTRKQRIGVTFFRYE